MCHMGYRTMCAADFTTWADWVKAVNDNERYCAQLPPHRVMEGRFKCRTSSLPSFHPYWKMMTHRQRIKERERHERNLAQCLKNRGAIKHLYNAATRIQDIQERINLLPSKGSPWFA